MDDLAPASSVLTLRTSGLAYEGWKAVEVTRRMDQCAGSYTLDVSDVWPGQDYTRRIDPGAECEVLLGGERVITGYVDSVALEIDAGQHRVRVAGRDRTGDLVDCSAVRKTGQWRGLRIEQIAAELCEPFGVVVRAEVDTGKPLPSFALQEGETVFEAIERAARIRGLLLMSDGQGALLITRAGLARVATRLVLGQNVLRARSMLDMRDRYSSYTCKGQAPGNDQHNGKTVSQIAARAEDAGVQRYRPLVLTNDAPDLAASLRERVRWEANVRAARSAEIEITVQGWRHDAGLWQPNTLVPVVVPALRMDAELLITSVANILDEQGSTTTLLLTRPDAYSVADVGTAPKPGAEVPWWYTPKVASGAAR